MRFLKISPFSSIPKDLRGEIFPLLPIFAFPFSDFRFLLGSGDEAPCQRRFVVGSYQRRLPSYVQPSGFRRWVPRAEARGLNLLSTSRLPKSTVSAVFADSADENFYWFLFNALHPQNPSCRSEAETLSEAEGSEVEWADSAYENFFSRGFNRLEATVLPRTPRL